MARFFLVTVLGTTLLSTISGCAAGGFGERVAIGWSQDHLTQQVLLTEQAFRSGQWQAEATAIQAALDKCENRWAAECSVKVVFRVDSHPAADHWDQEEVLEELKKLVGSGGYVWHEELPVQGSISASSRSPQGCWAMVYIIPYFWAGETPPDTTTP